MIGVVTMPAALVVSPHEFIAWQCYWVVTQRHALEQEAARDDWHGQIVKRVQPLEEE